MTITFRTPQDRPTSDHETGLQEPESFRLLFAPHPLAKSTHPRTVSRAYPQISAYLEAPAVATEDSPLHRPVLRDETDIPSALYRVVIEL